MMGVRLKEFTHLKAVAFVTVLKQEIFSEG